MNIMIRGKLQLMLGLLLLAGCAAQRNAMPEMMRHEAAYTYADMTDDQIYEAIRSYVTTHFQYDGEILQHADPNTNTIMARGTWPRASTYAPLIEVDIEYTLSADVIKGDVRFELSRLVARSPEDGEEMTFFSTSEQFHMDAEEKFQELVTSLDEALRATGRHN